MTSTCSRHAGNNERTWGAMAGWGDEIKLKSPSLRPDLHCEVAPVSWTFPSLQRWISMWHFFHIRQQFYHELRCNYKLCRAQLKVEDVRVSERTSAAVCHRASRGWGRGVKWGLHDLRYVLSLHQTPTSFSAEHKYVCVCVCVSLSACSVSFSQVFELWASRKAPPCCPLLVLSLLQLQGPVSG